LKKNKHKLQRQIIISESIFGMSGTTADGKCPFLNAENRCEIYDERPEVCRKFGSGDEPMLDCEYMSADNKMRTDEEREAVVQARKDYVKTLFKPKV